MVECRASGTEEEVGTAEVDVEVEAVGEIVEVVEKDALMTSDGC